MVQNRNKLIDLFIGNISNAVIHQVLEKAIKGEIENEEISKRYDKEFKTSLNRAKDYREKINPINRPLPDKDIDYIKNKIINKVKAELNLRIEKGYKNIDLNLVDKKIDDILKDMIII